MNETVSPANFEVMLLADERAAVCHAIDLRAGLHEVAELASLNRPVDLIDREDIHLARLRAAVTRAQRVLDPRAIPVPLRDIPNFGSHDEKAAENCGDDRTIVDPSEKEFRPALNPVLVYPFYERTHQLLAPCLLSI